jgi:serpin B
VGTGAAAPTAATFTTVSAPVVEEEVNLTRPFLFVIHDVRLGIPMFLGRVTDPTVTAE